ncbi:MAG: HigA family addiction module antidote protein [Chlamydiia bacterium]|nr:HigA family addiction module antidote protein [Chlamydiia bacterium]MCP5492083.1 HigA family addiction module antidote protein [Chlamydiales bacterium]
MTPTNRRPTLPGRILLEEFLIPLNLTQSEFVSYLGGSWTQPKLSAIISGKRSITEAIALDLADTLCTTPEFWIGLQMDVKLWDAARKRKPLAKIPRKHTKKLTISN